MKEYLLHEFGKESGKRIFGEIAKECAVLEELCTGESSANAKTMRIKIFPRVAMYRVLKRNLPQQKAYDIVWDYTKTCICVTLQSQYGKMEKIPFFFFQKMFLYTVLHSSLWEAEAIQSKPDQLGFMVHRCLWNDTCQKCGCPELCKVFCDSDWENFGAMHKIRFSRTQTLGTGGKVCDFTFSK